MADMLKNFVDVNVKNYITSNYPHIEYPMCIYARVVDVEYKDGNQYCTLKILNSKKEIDERFATYPYVKTDIELNINNVAVVCMIYGTIPYILGRANDD